MRKLLLILLLFFCYFTYSQDSIVLYQKKFAKAFSNKEKINYLQKIVQLYENNLDSQYQYLLKLNKLAKKANVAEIELQTNIQLCEYYYKRGEIYNALDYAKPVRYSNIKDVKWRVLFLTAVINTYLRLENYDSASTYLYYLLKIPDSTLNRDLLLIKQITIANAFLSFNMPVLAKFYIDRTERLVSFSLKTDLRRNTKYIKAKYYFLTGYSHYSHFVLENLVSTDSLVDYLNAYAYFLLGEVYFSEKKLPQSTFYYRKVYDVFKGGSYRDTLLTILSLINIATSKLEKGEYKIAQGTIKIVQELVEKIGLDRIPNSTLTKFYNYFYKEAVIKNNLSEALFFSENLNKSEQKYYEELQKAFRNYMLYRFEFANKDYYLDSLLKLTNLQNQILVTQRKVNKYQTFYIIFLLFVIGVLGMFLYVYYVKNKKIQLLHQQKEKANLELQLTTNRLENIVSFLPEILLLLDKNGKIVFANNIFYEKIDTKKLGDIQNRSFFDLFDEKNRALAIDLFEKLKITKKIQRFEAELRFVQDKIVVLVSLYYEYYKNDSFVAILSDITYLKEIEQNLKLFDTAIKQTNTVVVITDVKGDIVFVNPAFEKVTGYKAEEALGKNPRILKSGLMSDDYYKKLWDTILSKEVFRGTFINRKKSGDLYYERTIITPLTNSQGEITHFIATKDDITDFVKKNELFKKFFAIAEKSPISVIILDENYKITYVNDSFTKISGYYSSEVIGRMFNFLVANTISESFWKKVWTEVNQQGYWTGEYIKVRKNRINYWVNAVIVVIYDDFGKISGYVVNEQDITLNKITQQQLELVAKALNNKTKEIESSLLYAQRIQKALLPSFNLFEKLFNGFILYLPKDILSGDFYWFTQKGHYKFLALGDCTGHGVPAAFLSILGLIILEDAVNVNDLIAPSSIIAYLSTRLKNLFLVKSEQQNIFDDIEISLLVIDTERKLIIYAGSRSNMYLLRTISKKIDENVRIELLFENESKLMYSLKTPREFLILADIGNLLQEIYLFYHPSDIFYLSTDGYYDQFGGPNNKKMLRKEFEKFLFSLIDKPLNTHKELILENLVTWKGTNEQNDDISVIGFQIP